VDSKDHHVIVHDGYVTCVTRKLSNVTFVPIELIHGRINVWLSIKATD